MLPHGPTPSGKKMGSRRKRGDGRGWDARGRGSGVGTMGTGGYIVPQVQNLYPLYPRVKDAAYVKILSKRLLLQDCIRFVQICTPTYENVQTRLGRVTGEER